jgi:hypothetical protein
MQILSIGIYKATFAVEYFANHPSQTGNRAAAEIESIVNELRDSHFQSHLVHHCTRSYVNYFIKLAGNHIFVCGVNNAESIDEINRLFVNIEMLVASSRHAELGEIIENPEYQPSRIEQAKKAVTETNTYLDQHVTRMLKERSDHMEELLKKTQSLCDNPVTFKTRALHGKHKNEGFFRTMANYFCFFSCGSRRQAPEPKKPIALQPYRR